VISPFGNSQVFVHSKMPVKSKIPYPDGIFFITFTCYQWLPLIEMSDSYDLVYKWFDHLKEKGHFIVGYQLMPNHVHALLAFRNTGRDINRIIGNGKRFIAYGIVERLEQGNHFAILANLQKGVNSSDCRRGKKHEVWEDSFDWKDCRSRRVILQKLDYMHGNSCKGKWQLAESPADYPHSSAKFYISGEQGVYAVTNYLELEDVDLTVRRDVGQQK
jgi:REP element-mobilizing transposase RayT